MTPASSSSTVSPDGAGRVGAVDTFRGFTIFAMIFVIMVAGYHRMPLTFRHLGSAPVSTFRHAAEDGRPDDWAWWEGRTPASAYRRAKVLAVAAAGRYDVVVLDPAGATEAIVHGAEVWAAAPLAPGERLVAVPQPAPAAYTFKQVGIGLTFTDLVAPFFVFIVGLCVPLSRRRHEAGWWRHVAWRTLGLLVAGVVYISLILHLSYWWGILQAIAVAYAMAAVAVALRPWQRWVALAAVATVHAWATWHVSWWVTLGDPSRPFWTVVTPDGDMLRPLTVHCTPWASIGYGLCAIAGTLVGDAVATRERGRIIRQGVRIGGALTLAGLALHASGVPMHKDYVSSSFALFSAGIGALTFVLLYLVIDVAGFRRWTGLFDVFGTNALLAYFTQPLVRIVLQALGLYQGLLGQAGWMGMLAGLEWTMLLWCVVWWCNRKGIYWTL